MLTEKHIISIAFFLEIMVAVCKLMSFLNA